MSRRLSHIIAAVLVLRSLSSCDYRDLDMIYYETSDVWIGVDWSRFTQEEPSGMSVYCYPKDRPGDEGPYVYLSNNTSGVMANLPVGHYDILVFNQSVDEFGSMHFEGMESYSTAKAVLEDLYTKWKVKSDDQTVSYQPDWLAVDTYEDFYVSTQMVKSSASMRELLKTKGPEETSMMDPSTKAAGSVTLRPENQIYTAKVSVGVQGFANLRSTRGSMTGMARTLMLASGERCSTPTTHALESWNAVVDASDSDRGYVYTAFRTFGYPSWTPLKSSESVLESGPLTKGSGTADPQDNLMNIEFLLVDNSTICTFTFRLGGTLKSDDSACTTDISIGMNGGDGQEPSTNADPARPCLLPTVQPAGSGGGFSASVEDWGEEEQVDVPLG